MIALRKYSKKDADRLVDLANHKSVSQYLTDTFPYPYTQEDAEWWISTGSMNDGAITRVIEYEGVMVGSIGLTPQIGWRNHVVEIGYWIGEAYWGNGIASNALQEMTDTAFSELGYQKIIAPVLAPNKASMRVLEKQDYELEGVLKNDVHKEGKYFDIHHFARYRP